MTQFADHARLLNQERVNLDPDEPCSGWFRTRRVKNGPFLPVQVTRGGDFDAVEVLLDGKPSTPEGIGWPYVAKNAIPRAHYDHFMRHRKWPDVDDAAHAATIGGNNPPPDEPKTPEAELEDKIRSALKGLGTYAKWGDGRVETLTSHVQDQKVDSLVDSDEMSGRAQTLRSLLLELKGSAEKQHKAEKEPHLRMGREVDAKWFGMAKLADAGILALRAAMSAWETVKLTKRRAEEKAIQDAAAALAAVAEAAKTGKPAEVVAPPPAAPPPAAPRRIKGGSGRAASVGVVRVVKEVSDWTALFLHFREYDEVKALLVKCANEQLKLGNQVPGVVVAEKADVK